MRLDEYLFKNQYFDSRTKAVQSIKRGEIYLNGVKVCKPSFFVDELKENLIKKEIQNEFEFVSLGGYKLFKALIDFKFDVNGLVCVDVGASTGGFTDCLIKKGADKVFAVDLNDTLLHSSLVNNAKVVPVIKNAKDLALNDFNTNIDFLCADLSFISATQVIKGFYNILPSNKSAILLIKPQFENDKRIKVKNGIIRQENVRKDACQKIYDYAITCGFSVQGLTVAPINKDKNLEYLILLEKSDKKSIDFELLFNNCYNF